MNITRSWIINFINTAPPEVVSTMIGKALVALFNRQTEDEAAVNDTKHRNHRGFTSGDARKGSIAAKYYLKHGKLEDWQVAIWTRLSPGRRVPRIAKYWRQLDEVAQEKRNKAPAQAARPRWAPRILKKARQEGTVAAPAQARPKDDRRWNPAKETIQEYMASN